MTSIVKTVKTEVKWVVRYATNKVSVFSSETIARQYYEEKVAAGRKAVKLIKQTTTVTEEVVSR
jgi:hypothetical protein